MRSFRFGPAGGHPSNPWFRIGEFDVTTTILSIAATIVTFFLYAIDKTQLRHLFLGTPQVRDGEAWRVLTWPFYNRPSGWAFISLLLFYLWGSRVEADLGRFRMLWLLFWMTLVPAAILVAFNRAPETGGGMRFIGIAMFVAFAIEYPHIRFFLNIPSWVMAVGFIGLDALGLLGDEFYNTLWLELLVIATTAVVLRQFGLAGSLQFIPKFMGSQGSGRAGRASRPKARKRSKAPLSVVPEWTPPRQPSVADHEVDELLDKIAAHGLDSLTKDERKRLDAASKRLRGERG